MSVVVDVLSCYRVIILLSVYLSFDLWVRPVYCPSDCLSVSAVCTFASALGSGYIDLHASVVTLTKPVSLSVC